MLFYNLFQHKNNTVTVTEHLEHEVPGKKRRTDSVHERFSGTEVTQICDTIKINMDGIL